MVNKNVYTTYESNDNFWNTPLHENVLALGVSALQSLAKVFPRLFEAPLKNLQKDFKKTSKTWAKRTRALSDFLCSSRPTSISVQWARSSLAFSLVLGSSHFHSLVSRFPDRPWAPDPSSQPDGVGGCSWFAIKGVDKLPDLFQYLSQLYWCGSVLVVGLVLRCRFVFVVGDLFQRYPTARLMLISLSLFVRRCRLF